MNKRLPNCPVCFEAFCNKNNIETFIHAFMYKQPSNINNQAMHVSILHLILVI